eukprot:2676059-Lingulodinium_polyedra.AAC.1
MLDCNASDRRSSFSSVGRRALWNRQLCVGRRRAFRGLAPRRGGVGRRRLMAVAWPVTLAARGGQ